MAFISGLFGGQQEKENPYTISNQQLDQTQANQNQLVGQLQQQAAGGGPSVANAFLKNSAEQAGANAAGMAAANRGNNSGLALRSAMQTGQQALQGAAAQGAQAKMQEQLNAQNTLGGQLNTMQGQGIQSQQAKASINAGIGAGNAQRAQSAGGGLLGGIGSALGLAEGGMVPQTAVLLADGGMIPAMPIVSMPQNTDINPFAGLIKKKADAPAPAPVAPASGLGGAAPGDKALSAPYGAQFGPSNGPQSLTGKFVAGLGSVGGKLENAAINVGKGIMEEPGKIASDLKSQFAKGGKATKNMKTGGHVPGKPKVSGAVDSYSNDTVKAVLSPGEIVIPRSITQKPNAAELAAKFVAATKAKKGK